MDKKFFIPLITILLLIGGVFGYQMVKQEQIKQNGSLNPTNSVTKTPKSNCDTNQLQEFRGKYYSFRYPCEYITHFNPSDDRVVYFGSQDYLARLEKDGASITSPQGYIITVSYNDIRPSINESNKNQKELWINWMGRGMGSIGKSEFLGMTKDENGKDIFKSVTKGYGFMNEMKESQVNIRIGLHNEDYTKSVEVEILTPEKDLKQNEDVLNNVIRTFSFN